MDSVNQNPKESLLKHPGNLNINAWFLLYDYVAKNIKAYKPHFLAPLEIGDEIKLLDFCLWMKYKITNNLIFFSGHGHLQKMVS